MPAYRLWHANQPTPHSVEGYLVDSDSSFLGTGTEHFVDVVQEALRIEAPRRRWRMTPVRNNYFAAYRTDASSWEDAWNVAWHIVIEWPEAVALGGPALHAAVGVDAADASHSKGSPYDWDEIDCWVIGDAADAAAAATMRDALVKSGATVGGGLAFGRFPQVRVELGKRTRAFFEAGAAEAEALVAQLDAMGASTGLATTSDWRHTRWRAR